MKSSNRIFGAVAAVAALAALCLPVPALAQETGLQQLLQELRQARQQEQQENQRRINEFIERVNEREALMNEAVAERDAARERRDQLQSTFDANEEQITKLNEELSARTGDFGEVFGVIRQVAGDARSQIQSSLTSSQYPERDELLGKLAESKALPSVQEIEALWTTMLEEMVATGQVARYRSTIVDPDGTTREAEVLRVGPFNAMVEDQFLNFTPSTQELSVLPRQPEGRWQSLAENLYTAGGGGAITGVVDPSRGAILSRLIQKPTFVERIQQGGVVGYVVIAIGILGLLMALERLFTLGRIERRINAQREDLDSPRDDNPLGQVLQAYHDNAATDTETLELKLDEAILKNLPPLERRLATLRIFSAVAPMLGLLGTVVGMIAVFQAITLFGTGDPKLMAGGISQALVTTALGLITAVPLILLHSVCSGRSRKLVQMLEQQASGIVAGHAEGRAQAHA